MEQRNISEFTDQELLQEAKRVRSTYITDGILVGFLIGVIFYSIVNNSVGFLTLIPVFFVYKLLTKPKYNKQELENLLKERNLK